MSLVNTVDADADASPTKKIKTNPPPVPPDQDITTQIALKGAIGQALEQALEDLQEELGPHEATAHDTSDATLLSAPEITPTALHCIQASFGRSVASMETWDAPAAVMKGRLDHYNRFQGQWRIVVDSQAEIAPRPLDAATSRKKKDLGKSLFDGTDTAKLDSKVQMLLYNDL